jgi:hypothetical protein
VAALLTAAFHERVRLVICHQGSAFFGFGIDRHVTHWYAAVQRFQDREDRLPVDTHCLVAELAPRPILFSTSRTAGLCWPRFDAAMISGPVPVYRLLGEPIQALAIPKSGVGIIGTGPVRMYHRDGEHTITQEDWKYWLDFPDEYFKGGGGARGPNGQDAPRSCPIRSASGNLACFRGKCSCYVVQIAMGERLAPSHVPAPLHWGEGHRRRSGPSNGTASWSAQ